MKFGVIGSGHAAVMAGYALVKSGHHPVFIDMGERLSPERADMVAELAAQDPSEWPVKEMTPLTENKSLSSSGAMRKLVYGSDFLYAENRAAIPTSGKGTKAAQTFAKGGFSIGWGGAMMPANDCDLEGWPVDRQTLKPYYEKVLGAVPMAGAHDHLEQDFPLYAETLQTLELDDQSAAFWRDFDRYLSRRDNSGDDRIVGGYARVAARADQCRYCGLCLSGCPYGVVYTADQLLDAMVKNGEATYISGTIVRRLKEENGRVEVLTVAANGQPGKTYVFDRVLLGAGAIGSTRIMLESLERYDQELSLLDSEKFALPIVRLWGKPIKWPNSNTLPALFLETRMQSVAPNWLHMQISSTNDLLLQKLFARKGHARNLLGKLLTPIISRLMIGFCGIHSNLSAKIGLTLKRRGSGSVLELRQIDNLNTRKTVSKYNWRFFWEGLKFKSLFVPFITQYWEPGITGHCGGSFPMTSENEPGAWNSSDIWGRPQGFSKVHLVDATTFPTIPGTTVSLLIMANAYRIAEHAAETENADAEDQAHS